MPGSFSIGSIGGIRITINLSWLIIIALLTFSLATGYFPSSAPGYAHAAYWLVALGASLLLFVAVLLHELGHSLLARARGLHVSSITLFIFGGVSNLEEEPHSPGEEFWVAIIGPAISLVLGALLWPLGIAFRPVNPLLASVFYYLGSANVLLGLYNLIPGFPLDGGRALRALLWGATGNLRRATLWAGRVGQVIAYLFILLGLAQIFLSGAILSGVWLGFIGWFLLNASQSATTSAQLERLFQGVTVGDLMTPPPHPVDANLPVIALIEGHLLPAGARSAPVIEGERFAGLVTLADVRHTPRERWAETPVGRIMIPFDRLHTVAPRQPLSDALSLMTGQDIGQLPVVQDGHLIGFLTRDAVMRYIEARRGHGATRPLAPAAPRATAPEPSAPRDAPPASVS